MLKKCVFLVWIFPAVIWANPEINERLLNYGLDVRPQNISRTPIDGLYEVVVERPNLGVLYISSDGRFLSRGEIVDLETQKNITEARLNGLVKNILDKIDDNEKVIFKAADEQYRIHVFTDVDCPWCQKFHGEIETTNALGITVKYLAFPRAGVGSASYRKMVAVWCADNPQEAMTHVKKGGDNPRKNCDHPIIEHLNLVRKLGIQGTPAIYFENGAHIPGYVEPEKLFTMLEGAS